MFTFCITCPLPNKLLPKPVTSLASWPISIHIFKIIRKTYQQGKQLEGEYIIVRENAEKYETRAWARHMASMRRRQNSKSLKTGEKNPPLNLSTTVTSIPSSKLTSLLISPASPVDFVCVSGLPAEIQNLGASSAACGVKPRSMLSKTWMWPWGYRPM